MLDHWHGMLGMTEIARRISCSTKGVAKSKEHGGDQRDAHENGQDDSWAEMQFLLDGFHFLKEHAHAGLSSIGFV